MAAIATAVVDPAGPLTGKRREVLCVASSFSQARIVFEDVLYFLRSAGHDLGNRKLWRFRIRKTWRPWNTRRPAHDAGR